MFGLGPQVPQIDAKDVYDQIKKGSDALLIDVRTAGEVEKGKIKGSLHVPLDQLESSIVEKIPDKDKTIYVYCLSGARSAQAVLMMQQMGYKKVFSMKSGLLSWRSHNFPLENV